MENPIKMDDLGVPLFLETPIYSRLYRWYKFRVLPQKLFPRMFHLSHEKKQHDDFPVCWLFTGDPYCMDYYTIILPIKLGSKISSPINQESQWPFFHCSKLKKKHHKSGDSGMYPYQRTPIGNPYISPI